jgi:hypothetical protein
MVDYNLHRITANLFELPESLYKSREHIIDKLCTNDWKYLFEKIQKFKSKDINRWCSVNSPLHYTLCDAALWYLNKYCDTCRYVMTTNADNGYSPVFFEKIFQMSNVSYWTDSFDIALVNMVTKGKTVNVIPKKGYLDLGSYIVRMDFIRKHNMSFLSSLPPYPDASNYHDADFFFFEKAVRRGARLSFIKDTLFFHN